MLLKNQVAKGQFDYLHLEIRSNHIGNPAHHQHSVNFRRFDYACYYKGKEFSLASYKVVNTIMGRNVILLTSWDRERYECPFCILVLDDPFQLECGTRVCRSCMETILLTNERDPVKCFDCGVKILYQRYFRDKACTRGLNSTIVKCGWEGCQWIGLYCESLKHEEMCKWVIESCTHCKQRLLRQEMQAHLDPENYDTGCNCLQRCCLFKQFGCKFKGNNFQMNQHESSSRGYHFYLSKERPINEMASYHMSHSLKIEECRYQILTWLCRIEKIMGEVDMVQLNLHDGNRTINEFMEIQKAQLELKRLMCGNTQSAHIFDELRPCYSFIHLFEITNLTCCIDKAKQGHYYLTEEICTGTRGYIIAYMIYLNGERTKDSWGYYISIYLLIKKDGYFDESLQWPFAQPVMLTLLMKDHIPSCYQMVHKRDQSVFPVPMVNSYQVVSGCVNFAPVRILSDRNFVENDCLHLLCSLGGNIC